jgi:hypothetical protein
VPERVRQEEVLSGGETEGRRGKAPPKQEEE